MNVNALLLASLEASPQGVVLLDAVRDASGNIVDFRLVYTNASAAKLLGQPGEFFNGKHLRPLLAESQAQGIFETCVRVTNSGTPFSGEIHHTLAGRNRWFEARVFPVDTSLCATFQEIGNPLETDRFARAIVGALPFNIAILDEEGFILAVNDAWNRFAAENNGPSDNRSIGLNYFDACAGHGTPMNGSAEKMAHGLRDVISGKLQTFTMEYPCHSPVEQRWFEARATRFLVHDKVRVIVSHENITRRKMTEFELKDAIVAAKKASEAKSQFLANMSHEIRTPMTAILGFTGMLEELWERGIGRQQRAEIFSTIRRSGEHLLSVVNDILDIAKIESDQVSVENIDTDPLKIVEHVVASMQASAKAKDIGLELDLLTTIPQTIKSDPTRLQQILINLVANAVKFTGQGHVNVSVAVDKTTDGKPALFFKVKDTGIGISPEVLPTLFQAFQQADTSHTRKYGGTGLGLRISRRLAQLMGGDITVESRPNQGSTFTLTLPIQQQDPAANTNGNGMPGLDDRESPVDDSTARQMLEGTCILVVEDNPDNQRLLLNLLVNAGAKVTLADNGLHAIELMSDPHSPTHVLHGKLPYNLVLMDIQMPVLDGYEATRKLRGMGLLTPIIAVTAHAQKDDRAKCLAVGCDDYITKPINRAALLKLCTQWVGVGIARQSLIGE